MDKKTSHTLANFGFIFARVYIFFPTASKNTAGSLRRSCQGCAIAGLFQRCEGMPNFQQFWQCFDPHWWLQKRVYFKCSFFVFSGGVVLRLCLGWSGFETLFGVGVVFRPKTRQKHLQKLHKWLQCYLETSALPLVSKSARKMPVLVSGYIKLPPSKL